MLMIQKSFTEAARALSLWVGMLIDEAHSHPDADKRAAADDLVQMLTPIIRRTSPTWAASARTSRCRPMAARLHPRERRRAAGARARITQLYEGTNGIQALDLVGRKLPMKGGQAAQRLLGEMSAFITANKTNDRMKEFVEPLEKALAACRTRHSS